MNTKRFLCLGLLVAALILAACGPDATPEPTATSLLPLPLLVLGEGGGWGEGEGQPLLTEAKDRGIMIAPAR